MKLFYLNFLTTLIFKKDRQQKPTSPVAGMNRKTGEQGSQVTEMFNSGLRTHQGTVLGICKRRGILKPLANITVWNAGRL